MVLLSYHRRERSSSMTRPPARHLGSGFGLMDSGYDCQASLPAALFHRRRTQAVNRGVPVRGQHGPDLPSAAHALGTSLSFSSIKRRKIHEDVAAQIEAAIVSGEFAEGDLLPTERQLMVSFGVGRPAVREALLLLEKSGFLRSVAGGRPRVSRPTIDVMVDQLSGTAKHFLASEEGERAFQDARRIFEAAIARNAAEVATPQEIARLSEALEENRAALDDMVRFEETDVAFHLALAKIGDNPVFAALHGAISEWLSMQRHVALRVDGVAEQALRSHERIFKAVAARQPDEAWRAMDRHLREIKEHIEQGADGGR